MFEGCFCEIFSILLKFFMTFHVNSITLGYCIYIMRGLGSGTWWSKMLLCGQGGSLSFWKKTLWMRRSDRGQGGKSYWRKTLQRLWNGSDFSNVTLVCGHWRDGKPPLLPHTKFLVKKCEQRPSSVRGKLIHFQENSVKEPRNVFWSPFCKLLENIF